MTTDERRRRRFTEEFRKEQVMLYEQGKLTIPEICRLYEVAYDTVKRWIKKYGKKAYPEMIIIGSSKEADRVKKLEKEISELKRIIGDQQVELLYKSKLVELAKDHLGEDFEKKCGPQY